MFSLSFNKSVFSRFSSSPSARKALNAQPPSLRSQTIPSTPAKASTAARLQGPSLNAAIVAPKAPAMHLQAQQRLLQATAKRGTWGGNLELVALARSLGLALHIIRKDPQASARFARHQGRQLAVINEGGGRDVFLAYDGVHYDALLNAEADGQGNVQAFLSPVPGDGDCMYHAVAAAGLSSFTHVPGLYATGMLRLTRQSPVWAGVFAGEPGISDEDAFGVMREAYVLQLRYDAAKELAKPAYAEKAFLQELAD